MTEFDPRWLDDASVDGTLRDLVASAMRDDPTPAELDRVTAKLAPLLGNGAPPAPPSEAPPPAPTAPAMSGTLASATKLGAALAVIGVAGTLISLATTRPSASHLERSFGAIVWHSTAAPAPSAPAAEPVAPAETRVTPSVARPAPSSSAVEPEDELSLLRRAHAALRSGQAANALAVTLEHAKLHPRSALGQEREVIAIEALERLGRHSEAESRGNAFLKAFPRSSHARRVRNILGLPDDTDEKRSSPSHNPPAVSP